MVRTVARNNEGNRMLDRVARLHYEHGLTHNEIARLLGLSRVKVTRMLAEARRTGVVEIRIHGDTHTFAELESALLNRYDLDHAWVVPSFKDPDRQYATLGTAAAHSLHEFLKPGSTVAVGLSRAVSSIPRALNQEHKIDATFVPLVGSRGGLQGVNAHETAEALARAFGGKAHHLPAPVITRTSDAAAVLRQEPDIADTLKLASKADIMVAGIGGSSTETYLVAHGDITADELQSVVSRGAVGDLSARFFDANGEPVTSDLDARVIGLSLDELRQVPCRIGVVGGRGKRLAARAVARGRIVNVLVTDLDTATWLATADD
jgi:lsr operon transcriptional repressor